MIVLGIDPGLDGALAILGDGRAQLVDLPTREDAATGRRIDGPQLADLLTRHLSDAADVHVCIEALSNGGEGRGQHSTVGSQFWTQAAIVTTLELLGLKVSEHVYPVTWKKLYNLGGKQDTPKETMRKARQLVAELYPTLADSVQRQKDHNRAEAVLIAHWYRKVRA